MPLASEILCGCVGVVEVVALRSDGVAVRRRLCGHKNMNKTVLVLACTSE